MEDYRHCGCAPLAEFHEHKGNKTEKAGGGLPEDYVDAGTAGKEGARKEGIRYPAEGGAGHVNIAEDAAGNGEGNSGYEPHAGNGDKRAYPLADAQAGEGAIIVTRHFPAEPVGYHG